MTGYDPYYLPDEGALELGYDTIVCNYVLNVVDKEEQEEILKQLDELLLPGGRIYVAVRMDVKKDTATQRRVLCPQGYNLLELTGWYAIYFKGKAPE